MMSRSVRQRLDRHLERLERADDGADRAPASARGIAISTSCGPMLREIAGRSARVPSTGTPWMRRPTLARSSSTNPIGSIAAVAAGLHVADDQLARVARAEDQDALAVSAGRQLGVDAARQPHRAEHQHEQQRVGRRRPTADRSPARAGSARRRRTAPSWRRRRRRSPAGRRGSCSATGRRRAGTARTSGHGSRRATAASGAGRSAPTPAERRRSAGRNARCSAAATSPSCRAMVRVARGTG